MATGNERLTICGLAAVRARFERDAASIERLFFDYQTGRKIGMMCQALAKARKVYRCVEPPELEKIAGTIHHGGIVAVVAPKPLASVKSADIAGWVAGRVPVLVLDRIGNAHNLGAIARTAAFFGIAHLVIPDDPAAAGPSDSAHRVAEGGFEALKTWRVDDLGAFIRQLARAGYETVGATVRGKKLAGPAAGGNRDRGPKTGPVTRQPVALVLGNEEHGLAVEVEQACTRLVTIPGSGRVESLNVSVAAGVLMWELISRPRG